ncbi:MAG: hypothetical protein WAK28_00880 [Trebonia sp.]
MPSLNTLMAALHPGAEDRSVLVLNALLGLGTALAPAFVAVFNGIGFWIGLPILSAVLLAGLIAVSLRLPLSPAGAPGQTQRHERARTGLPAPFWVFGLFAFLYGICETMNGNWSQLDLASLGVKSATASLALTGFWAMVTVGRVLIAVLQRWLPSRAAYHGLPFLLAAAFRSSRRCRMTRQAQPWPPSAWPGSAARRCCRSQSASARRSWPATRPRWPAGSSRVTRAGTASPRSAWARWSVLGSAYPRSSRPARW